MQIQNPFEVIDARLDGFGEILKEIQSLLKSQNRLTDSEPIEARITKKQAAALINCSVSTIDNARRAGKITAYRIGGKAVRFDKSEVLNLAKK
jgi:excisionase family DNA binding protein